MPPATHSYHHGALRQALIEATEALLTERGAEAFSLREVARRAGVSPAAPAHHFGDAAGLLTAVATLGFESLTLALKAADSRGGHSVRARLREQGLAYVAFALRHPGRFRLMFRGGVLRPDALLDAHGHAAYQVLEQGVRRAFGLADIEATSAAASTAVLALWSVVHGYAHLAIAGRFEPLHCAGNVDDFAARTLGVVLDAVLQGTVPTAPLRAGPAT